MANRVLLEAGAASGREPTDVIQLRSYLSEFLEAQGMSLGADDESAFPMRLLHFRRTFVEKLFAIHGKVESFKRDGRPIGTYARHYYDLFKLSGQEAVIAMLKSEEYAAIKEDYDRISREYFPNSYFYPDDMKFANSDALFPPTTLSAALEGGLRNAVQTALLRALSTLGRPAGTIRQLSGAPRRSISIDRMQFCSLRFDEPVAEIVQYGEPILICSEVGTFSCWCRALW